MYETKAIAYSDKDVSEKECMTNAIFYRLSKSNDMQRELISSIEDRLHSILNKRVPTATEQGVKNPTQMSQDFATKIDIELTRGEDNTRRLEQIYAHLNQII